MPSTSQGLWLRWKGAARKIGNLQARAFLFLAYFVVVAPFALAVRWLRDPLAIKSGAPRAWLPRPPDERSNQDRARQQF